MKPIFSPSSISLQVWPNITERFYIKELDEVRQTKSEEAQAALPRLETLVDKQEAPQKRLAAARWLRLNSAALPAAITVLMELAFDGDAQIAWQALTELATIDHAEAAKGLRNLTKWGSSKQIRERAAILLELRKQDDWLAAQNKNDQSHASDWLAPLAAPEMMTTPSLAQATIGGQAILTPSPMPSALGSTPISTAWQIMLRLLRHDEEQTSWLPAFVLLLTTIAELLTLYPDPRYGVMVHIAILFLLFYSLFHTVDASVRRFTTVLLLIPLIRILSLALPLLAWPQITWYFAASVPLFAGMITVIWLEKWQYREELGFQLGSLPSQGLIMLGGIGLGWLEYQILQPNPLIPELTLEAIWLPALIFLFCTGLMEELLFRGLLQSAALKVLGRQQALFFGSAFFAVMHIGYASILDVLFVFAVGWVFAWLVDRTHSILGVTLAHGLTNIGLFLVWPLM